MSRVYETTDTVRLFEDVMYTGGGIRRACTPVATIKGILKDGCVVVDNAIQFKERQAVTIIRDPSNEGFVGNLEVISNLNGKLCFKSGRNAPYQVNDVIIRTFNLASPPLTYTKNIVIDSVLFDGNKQCNSQTHDWRFNNTLPIRGDNIVRNSVFKNTPSENLTGCRGVFEDNIAVDLDGSFIHISCSPEEAGTEKVSRNYTARTNLVGDEIMGHSEGTITFSSNSRDLLLRDNVFLDGGEGVFGFAGPDDEGLHAQNDCYAKFPRVITIYGGANSRRFVFRNVSFIDIGKTPPIPWFRDSPQKLIDTSPNISLGVSLPKR